MKFLGILLIAAAIGGFAGWLGKRRKRKLEEVSPYADSSLEERRNSAVLIHGKESAEALIADSMVRAETIARLEAELGLVEPKKSS